MDFNDTPQEAEYRTKARAWLEENASEYGLAKDNKKRSPVSMEEEVRIAKEWQAKKAGVCNQLGHVAQAGYGFPGILNLIPVPGDRLEWKVHQLFFPKAERLDIVGE